MLSPFLQSQITLLTGTPGNRPKVELDVLTTTLADTDSALRPLTGSRVRLRPLAAHRQTTAVPKSSIAPDVHQTLDRHVDLSAKITLDQHLFLEDLAKASDLVVG
jgi:hypothetical protein